MTEDEEHKPSSVELLIGKAVKTTSADEALKFSQGACNTANAFRVLAEIKIMLSNSKEGS